MRSHPETAVPAPDWSLGSVSCLKRKFSTWIWNMSPPHREHKARSLITPPFVQGFLSHMVGSHKCIKLCDVRRVSSCVHLCAYTLIYASGNHASLHAHPGEAAVIRSW